MTGNRRRILALSLLVTLAAGLSAWDWPFDEPQVVRDFAGDDGGQFTTGLVLQADQQVEVRTVEPGEVIYVRSAKFRRRTQLGWGTREAVVVEHARGFRSLFSNLAQISLKADQPQLAQGAVIGSLARGRSDQNWLFLQIQDLRNDLFVNPSLLLPTVSDNRAPAIRGASASWGGGDVPAPLRSGIEVAATYLKLFANIRDYYSGNGSGPTGLPYRTQVFINGQIAATTEKIGLRPVDGVMQLVHSAGLTYDKIFLGDGQIYLGMPQLKDGANRLEIRVTDQNGNKSALSYRLVSRKRTDDTDTP